MTKSKVVLGVVLLLMAGCGGEWPGELSGGGPEEDPTGRQIQALSSVTLSPIKGYTETIYVFPALMRLYNPAQITSYGKLEVRVKLRAHEKAVGLIVINGKVVWFKTKMEAQTSETYDKTFWVNAGAQVVVGENGGSIERVGFTPSGSSSMKLLSVIKTWNQDVIPAPVYFRVYDKNKIKRGGVINFKIKLRGEELGVAAFKVNGVLKWKYWRISASSRTIERKFYVDQGAEVHVGEWNGNLHWTTFTPDGPYRLKSNRTGHCLQRVGSSSVEVRSCSTTSYQKLAFVERVCPNYFRIKFDGTNICLHGSGSSVVQKTCASSCDKNQLWVPGNDGRWRHAADSKMWLANESANGKVYLLWQNDPYNNNRTKWYRNDF